jgi:toxin FitB
VNYLLDTCLISELIKKEPEARVVEWVRRQSEERLYLSVLTPGEIQKGIAKLQDPLRANKLQSWLDDDLLTRFAGRILDVTPAVARTWGRIQGKAERQGRKMQVIDSLIAATALNLGAPLVTRNVEDVEASGVEIVNPWQHST